MVARYTGASLGLLAFTSTTTVGLLVRNPVEVTLSCGTLALFAFCITGLLLGTGAQLVVAEHENKRESEIRKGYREGPVAKDDGGRDDRSGEE